MTNQKLSYAVIMLSGMCIIALIIIDYSIFLDYTNSNGKNRALFGLTLILDYQHRHYIGLLTLIVFVISSISLIKKNDSTLHVTAVILALISVLFSFFEVWLLFV